MPTLHRDAPVWTLDIGDDENRFSLAWLEQIEAYLSEIETGDEPIALLTRGTGKFFSNGLDLEHLSGPDADMGAYVARVHEVFARVLSLPVPTVAAVNGHAFGAGAMLAIAHDYRVMREDRGFFCFPEVDIHIPFTQGMNDLIMAKLTPAAAVASMTTGHRFAGPDAAGHGLVDAATSLERLEETARGVVEPLAGKHRASMRTIKETMFAPALASLRG
jgi:enoyl-CoA hydratase/carnithine racemase